MARVEWFGDGKPDLDDYTNARVWVHMGDDRVADISENVVSSWYWDWGGRTSPIIGDITAYEVVESEAPQAKHSNPKDRIGSKKLPLDLVPDTMKAYATLAFLEGALKYGACNWRVAGVRASIYKAAAERHLMKWWNGEWEDPTTHVPHLASVLACVGIILDARVCDKLEDDRPPIAQMRVLLDGMENEVVHLQDLFKDHHPHHHTASDVKA